MTEWVGRHYMGMPKTSTSDKIEANHREVKKIIQWLAVMKERDYNTRQHKKILKRLEELDLENRLLKGFARF